MEFYLLKYHIYGIALKSNNFNICDIKNTFSSSFLGSYFFMIVRNNFKKKENLISKNSFKTLIKNKS